MLNSFDFSYAATTAFAIIDFSPSCSSNIKASAVVPPGEVTISVKIGRGVLSFLIRLILPSIVCNTNFLLTSFVSPKYTPELIKASII